VSDLYHETTVTSTAEPDTGWQPAQDAASYQQETAEPEPGHGYEAPAEADRYGGYHETQAGTGDRIAGQDELPTPAESRQATWGDNPDYYDDDAELGAEYDSDADAFLAEQDELPTPQESRAATWGDNPDYYDEADLATEYDGDLSALTTEEDSLAAHHAPASPDAEDTHTESAIPLEDTADSHARGTDSDNRGRDAPSMTDDQSAPAGTDLITTKPGPAYEGQATADTGTDAQASQADLAALPGGDDGNDSSPEADRFKALETEHDAARQRIAGLEAELKAVKDEQATRFDHIEQLLATTDRQPQGTDPPEDGADQPGTTRVPDAKSPTIADHKGTRQENDAKRAELTEATRWRRAVSSENVGIAGTLVGAADTVAQFAMHATPEGVAGLGAMVLGLASLGLAKAEKHRKGKA
jgi:hypothetical protein